MKKLLLTLFISSTLVLQIRAQEPTVKQRKQVYQKVDELLANYQTYFEFREIDRQGFSDAQAAKFKALFVPNATLFDDIVADKEEGVFKLPYRLSIKPIEQYIADVKNLFPNGVRADITRENISYSNLKYGEIKAVVERRINATTADGYTFFNHDTLLLTLKAKPDYSEVLIDKITMLASNLSCNPCPPKQCPHDRDCDGIRDEDDKCPDVKGVLPDGCPARRDNFGFAFSVFLAGVLNNLNFDYNNSPTGVIADKSNTGKLSCGIAPGFSAAAELDFLFGKKKNVGLSTGILFQQEFATIKLDGYSVWYQATDAKGTTYTRIVTASSDQEKLNMYHVTLPILIKYQGAISKQVGFFIHGGPVLILSTQSSNNAQATINYEAIYNYRNGHFEFDPTGAVKPEDWLLTKDAVTKHTSDVAGYFTKHQAEGYDVAIDQKVTGNSSTKFKLGFGGMIRAGFSFKVSKAASFLLGVNFMYASLTKDKATSFLLSDKVGDYTSALNGSSRLSVITYGINLGMQFKFFK